jgi:hypothetical protein
MHGAGQVRHKKSDNLLFPLGEIASSPLSEEPHRSDEVTLGSGPYIQFVEDVGERLKVTGNGSVLQLRRRCDIHSPDCLGQMPDVMVRLLGDVGLKGSIVSNEKVGGCDLCVEHAAPRNLKGFRPAVHRNERHTGDWDNLVELLTGCLKQLGSIWHRIDEINETENLLIVVCRK